MHNISSYNLLSKYYDKIYKFQLGSSSLMKRNKYINFLLSLVNKKKNFLDIGCGTGIYTNIISNYFEKSIGIDPCNDMIYLTKKKENLIFKNIYLENLQEKNFDLITSFTQVFNHISIDKINLFIENVSSKLNKNGIFYFDFFNYIYFCNFKPKNETRILDNECKYTISPILEKINKNLLKLKINNKIITKTEEHKYELNINKINFDLINKICKKNNLELIKLNNMLDIEIDINEKNFRDFAKFSAIYKKI